jgi:hypothetical protein
MVLSSDVAVCVRFAVACDPAADPEVVRRLTADVDPGVSRSAAANPACPSEVLETLAAVMPHAVLANPAARETLDSVYRVLKSESSDASDARRALSLLPRLLPRFDTRIDSTWVYIRMVDAHLMMPDGEARACTPLRSARILASTKLQRDAIDLYWSQLTCSP